MSWVLASLLLAIATPFVLWPLLWPLLAGPLRERRRRR